MNRTPIVVLAVAMTAAAAAAQAQPRAVSLVVTNGTVVTMDKDRRVIANGAVAIDGANILAVGPRAEIDAAYRGTETLDAGGGLVIPGLVNAHGHAPMVLFRGVADDLKLMDWLQKYIFPAEKNNVTAAFVKAGTELAALEMIRSGTTTFVDMYYFEDQVAEACDAAGMRCVPGSTLIEFPAPDNKTIPDALAYTEKFLQRWARHPRVTPAVAPHSAYLANPETLKAARALADKYGAPILIHLSESEDEQKQVKERYGKTPTEHLRDVGLLRKGVLGAHGIWLSESDRRILRDANVGIAHCPQSNMKLASGAAPVPAMLKEGARLGLGTDGAASNNDLDMFEEMMTAAFLAKHAAVDPTAAPATAVLEMATLGGARALGMEDRIGSLEAGKRADIVIVDVRAPRLTPLYDPVSHLVYAVKGGDVRHVIVDGKPILRDRKALTLDEAAVLARGAELARGVSASLRK